MKTKRKRGKGWGIVEVERWDALPPWVVRRHWNANQGPNWCEKMQPMQEWRDIKTAAGEEARFRRGM